MYSRRENASPRPSQFSEEEADFLAENFIGRLATASSSGQPHVVPVTYTFDGESIHFGGWDLASTLKYRNLASNPAVAFVVDEVTSVKPWRVKGVEVRGVAQAYVAEGGRTMVKISPKAVRSWGVYRR
ncbi:MAG: PPOX class F420-dependent oxidoreductase [archaeon]|nr:MAG: PPOX class F420-dependent oxidoreductase [archaeon]